MNRILVHHRVTPKIKCTGSDLYNWVERSSVRVKCFAQSEHNAVSLAGGEDLEGSALTMRPRQLPANYKDILNF